MIINRVGKKKSSRLPSSYQEVEYIRYNKEQGANSSWIDTGISGGLTQRGFEIKFLAQNTREYYIFGNFNKVGQAGIYINPADTTKITFTYYIDSNLNSIVLGGIGEIITAKNIGKAIYANGEQKGYISAGSTMNYNNLAIMGATYGSNFPADATIYEVKIYESLTEGSALIRHLIPCYRIADNRAGMFDLVDGHFYDSETTSNFIVGGDVN